MIVLPSVSSGVISSSFFDPKKISGLALWLKADAGVSKFSYNYVSTIIISSTSAPSFAGTYTADTVPTWDYVNGKLSAYEFTGPTAKKIMQDQNSYSFVYSDDGIFTSADGETWTPDTYIGQVVITGFTGIYSGANGTYNGDGYYFTKVGGGFFISGNELKDESEFVIATAPDNYSGSWTPTTYISSVTLTGANTTVVNGVYTRTDSEIDESKITFFGSGGKILWWNGDDWVAQSAEGENAYYLSDFNLITWTVSEFTEGTAPAPTGAIATSARSVGSPTSTSVTVPTGSISGSSIITVTVNTDDLTDWADQSGNGRNSYVDIENKPTYTIIGGKSFVNSAVASRLFLSNVIWSDVEFIGTIFFVARFNSSSAGYGSVLFYQEGSNGNLYFIRGIDSTNNFYITKNEGTNIVSSNVPADNNTNYIISTTFNESTASLYLNGAPAGSGPISSGTGYPVNSYIGDGQSEQFNVAEAIIYNRVLTTPEIQQVEKYLNAKYVIY